MLLARLHQSPICWWPDLIARLKWLAGRSMAPSLHQAQWISGSGMPPGAFQEVEVAALVRLADVLDEHAVVAPRIVARRRRPGLQALRDLGVVHMQVDRSAPSTSTVIRSPVRTAASGPPIAASGRDVQDAGAVARAAHARVGDAQHVAHALLAAASSASAACPIRACPARRPARRCASTMTWSGVTSRSRSFTAADISS